MAGRLQTALMIAVAGLLAACGSTGGGGAQAPVSQGPSTIVKGSTPVELYSHIARQVRACWFNPGNPVLKNHVFRAEAGAGGQSGNATLILINERTRDNKRGLKAFTIDFMPIRGGTQLIAQNHKLSYTVGQKMVADVDYWAQGGANCDGPAQAPGAAPRGSISGARISQ